MTERNRGPVEYMTVMYGSSQWRSYCCSNSITRRKNGCWGTEPMASLEIPVGAVRRTQAGYARRGSKRRLQPWSILAFDSRCAIAAAAAARSVLGTYVVEINISSTVVGEHKVPNRVCALDGVVVAIEGVQEPRVLGGNELARLFVCPELEGGLERDGRVGVRSAYNIFIVGVQVDTALLRLNPDLGNGLILVGLVNDLGDYLRALLDQAGVG